jgi:3-methyladenine DNA glycosylase/8-oxoguanine DNA glycosylase
MRAPTRPTRRQLAALAASDPVLAVALTAVPRYPGFPQAEQGRDSHFAYLARCIVFQQLAGAAARTIWGRVVALTPGTLCPRPPEILGMADIELRGAGLSAGKLAALRDLAGRVQEGRLRLGAIGSQPDDAVIERLITVRGIGVWTAQMFLMFRLGRLDVMPAGDLGVAEGLRRLDRLSERPAPQAVSERAERWAPLRTVAAWVLWRLTELDEPD